MSKKDNITLAALILSAFFIVFLLITFVFRSYQVDGPSMESTLQNGDKLIIWKVPRTWASITGHPYIPKRGDVIVFNEYGAPQCGLEANKQLIKRVIGLPGDEIKINDGHYVVYNKNHPNGYNPDQSLGYDKNNIIPETSGNIDYKLGSDQLFVSGDNRTVSLDSRCFGPIKASQIVGKLVLRILPINHMSAF